MPGRDGAGDAGPDQAELQPDAPAQGGTGFPTPDLVYSFPDGLEGDLLGGCAPVRVFQGETAVCIEWATTALDATGATLTLLAVPRRRRSTTYAFTGAVQAVSDSPATLRAFLPAGWGLDPGPYWFRVRSEGGPGGVADTSPVLVMVVGVPALTDP